MSAMDMISTYIQEEMDSLMIAGANVLAVKNDKIIYQKSFGYANLERQIPMNSDSIFRLYSLSKPITAVGVLKLIEDKKLKLTDLVSKYIKTFEHMQVVQGENLVPANKDITIFDLLTMTSGIVYPEDNLPGHSVGHVYDQCINQYINGQPTMNTLEFIEEIGKCPLAFQPGQEWRYGTSADVLGAIIEVVTGMKLGDYLKKTIFEPLGMEDTGFYIPKEKWDRQAVVYENNEETNKLQPYSGFNLAIFDPKKKPEFESGGAGVVSTIMDYMKFATMLLHKGSYQGKRILSEEMVNLMSQNHLMDAQKVTMNWYSTQGCGYGFLVRIMQKPEESDLKVPIGTYGWDGWTGPYLSIDVEDDMIVLYFIGKINTGTTGTTVKIHNELLHHNA